MSKGVSVQSFDESRALVTVRLAKALVPQVNPLAHTYATSAGTPLGASEDGKIPG